MKQQQAEISACCCFIPDPSNYKGTTCLLERQVTAASYLTPYWGEAFLGRANYAIYAARTLAARMGDAPLRKWPWMAWTERSGARLAETWMCPERRSRPGLRASPSCREPWSRGWGWRT